MPRDATPRPGWFSPIRFTEIQLIAVWLGLSFVLAATAGAPTRVLVHAGRAAASWIVLEYVLHRFVLHATGRFGRVMARLQLDVHWRHHLEPNRTDLVFTPWWATMLLVGVSGVAGGIIEGVPGAAGASLGMSLTQYIYETTHVLAHLPYRPRTRYGRAMRRVHMLHHFQNEHYWFGVLSPIGDGVARTWKAADAVERSPTVRTLGVDVAAAVAGE